MAWRELEKLKILKVTQKLAEEYAGRGNTGLLMFDRPFKRWRVSLYKKRMKEGNFRTTAWARCYCKEDGKWWRVNGQHTSIAVCELFEEGWVANFSVSLETYEADTSLDMRVLWNTFDTRDSGRDLSDINNSVASLDPRLAGVAKGVINTIVAGLSLSTWDQYYGQKATAEERAELLIEHADFAHWFVELTMNNVPGKKQRKKKLEKASVVATMFDTWQKFPQEATTFWEAVRDGNGPDAKVADRVLERFLIGSKEQRTYFEGLWMDYGTCRKAWNFWRKNQKIEDKDIKFKVKDSLPEII